MNTVDDDETWVKNVRGLRRVRREQEEQRRVARELLAKVSGQFYDQVRTSIDRILHVHNFIDPSSSIQGHSPEHGRLELSSRSAAKDVSWMLIFHRGEAGEPPQLICSYRWLDEFRRQQVERVDPLVFDNSKNPISAGKYSNATTLARDLLGPWLEKI